MDTDADAIKSAKAATQMVYDHPLSRQLSRITSPSVLTAIHDTATKDNVKAKRKTRHLSLVGRSRSEKAVKAKAKRGSLGFASSMHIDDLSDTKAVGSQREKLKSRMMMFLGKMQNNGEPRRSARTSSFFFGERKNSDQVGHLVDLKTFQTMSVNGGDFDEDAHDTEGGGKGGGGGGRGGEQALAETITPAGDNNKLLFLKPWVFNPGHTYRQSWDLIAVMLSLLYTAVRVPLAIAFDIDEFAQIDVWFIANRLVDMIFISDMIVIFLTAQKDGRKMITSHKWIAALYLKKWFLFDFIASIPLDVMIWISLGAKLGANSAKNGDYARSAKLIRALKIFRILRILRLVKMKRIVLTLEIFFGLNFSVMAIGKYAIAIALLGHLIACGFLGVSPKDDGWITTEEGSTESQYMASIYWTLTTMSTIGYGDIKILTTVERLYSIAAQLLGAVTFTYGVTRIVHILTNMGRSQRNLTNQLENVAEWARYHDFPQEMVNDIKKYLHYKASRSYFNEKSVLNGLSLTLRRTVLKHIYETALKKVELFSHCSDDFVTEIMLKMRSEFASPYSIIISQGSIGQSMYIIRKGFTAVYRGYTRRDIQSAVILGAGQAFGEISLLADNITRTASVVALEWVDMAVITREDFESLIQDFPREQVKMHKYAESKIKSWRLIRQREAEKKRAERPRTFSQSKSRGDNDTATGTTSHSLHAPPPRNVYKSIDDDIERFQLSAALASPHHPNDLGRTKLNSNLSNVEIMDNTTASISKQPRRSRSDSVQSIVDPYAWADLQFPDDSVLLKLSILSGEIQKIRKSWVGHLVAEDKIQKEIKRKKMKKAEEQKKGNEATDGDDEKTDDSTLDKGVAPLLSRHLTVAQEKEAVNKAMEKMAAEQQEEETYESTGSESPGVKFKRQLSLSQVGYSMNEMDINLETEDKESESTETDEDAVLKQMDVVNDMDYLPSSVDTDDIDTR